MKYKDLPLETKEGNPMKGEEIFLKTRILAVSDVVESMAFHRPYRPSLGIEAALEEIEKNKGTFTTILSQMLV